MIKYSVWCTGDDFCPAGLCIREGAVFLADTELEAALCREDFISWFGDENSNKYKICKIEIED